MNKFFICFFTMCLCASAYAQNNVGIGTPTPNAAAVLDLTATTQGFLAPRTQVGLVANPVAGLVIFDTDSNCYVMYNNTGVWKNLCSPGTAWLITGNSGTNSSVNFAGTTDAQDFVLKSNNSEVLRATTTGAVGINTPVPDPTSILDMTSSTRGVLFPALTTAQRDAITTPAVGLVVYNTDINVHQFWNGTCWVNVGQTVCSFVYNTSYVTPSHTSDCLLVSNFSSVSDTISVGLVSGTPSPVILTAVGVPAGVIVSFSNNYLLPSQTSIMTFTALPSAAAGTYNITVLATSGSTVQTLNYTLVVFGFNLAITPADTTVSSGTLTSGGYISQATVSIGNASSCGSSGGTAQLSATVNATNGGISGDVGVSFATTNMPIPGSTTMTLTSGCPPAGTYTITVQALIGVTSSYATYTLTVTGASPVHVTSNQTNLDLASLFPAGACAGSDTVYIDAGVDICSASPTLPAITTGAIPAGGSIVLINNGTITGAGGQGGEDPSSLSSSSCPSANGGNGGDAIFVAASIAVKVINNGTISGGGGGGGAGAALSAASLSACIFSGGAAPGGSGGGGAGCTPGAGGASAGCSAGNAGTATAGGSGGAAPQSGGCGCGGIFGIGAGNSGPGGSGGGLGQPGANGGTGTTGTGVCPAGTGGAPGYTVNGNGCSCATLVNNGTVNGTTHL